MKNKTFKKSISLIMTVLMIMSCWVFFPGMIPEASAALAYGMSAVGLGNQLNGSITTNVSGKTITIKYPTKMYLDITENLSDVGYSINVACNTNNKMIVYPAAWGGQESNTSGVFENDRTNYDANLGGQTILVDNFDKYGIQKTGPGYFDNETVGNEYATCLLHKNASKELSNGANYALQGQPKTEGSYRYYLVGNNSIASDTRITYLQTGGQTNVGNTSYISGNVDFTIVVYNKSALNTAISNNTVADSESVKYTDSSWNDYKNALTNAQNVLKTREVTQSDINTAKSNLESKRNSLQLKTFTVTFIVPTGASTVATKSYKYGDPLDDFVVPTRPGYTFKRWYADNNKDGKYTSGEDVTDANGNIVDAVKEYRIAQNWNVYSDWTPNTYKVLYDNLIDFGAWDKETAGNGTISNVTNDGFTLTCNEGAGEGTSSSPFFAVEPGKDYTVDIDVEGGAWDVYIFFCDANGTWIDFVDGESNRYSPGVNWDATFTAPNKSEVVKAQIRVDANGSNNAVTFKNIRVYEAGKVVDGLTSYHLGDSVTFDSEYGSLPTPTRTGYTFAGWIDKDGNAITADSTYDYVGTETLYSTWTLNSYDITWKYADNTTETESYNYGATPTAPANTAAYNDASGHHTFSWPTVSVVTGDATYTENKNTTSHTYKTTVTAPTCTAQGYTTYTCDCGHTYKDNYVAAKGHTWVDANCTTAKTCSVCGATEGNANGHTPGNTVVENNVAPTCTTAGSYDNVVYCTVCSAEISRDKVTVNALGHTEVVLEAVEATCTATGLTEGKKCSVCQEVLVKQEVTEKKDHEMGEWSQTKAPTCVTAGEKTRKCNNCAHTETQAEPATGVHVYGEWSQFNNGDTHRRYCTLDPLNCQKYEEGSHAFNGEIKQLADNYHQYKCEQCEAYGAKVNGVDKLNAKEACFGTGTTFTQIDGDASKHKETCLCGREKNDGHLWGAWTADPENKTDKNGKMSHTCSECYYKQTSDCEYTVTTVKASCEADGHITYLCADCGNGYSEVIQKREHVYEDVDVQTAATCSAEGVMNTICTNTETDRHTACTHESTRVIPIDADAHKYGEWTQTKAPTCSAKGEEQRICEYNPEHIDTKEVDIDSNAHDWNDWVQVTAPNCNSKGENKRTCKHNDEHYETKEVAIAPNAHDFTGEIKSDGNGEEATHSFKCKNGCGNYGNPVKHTWNSGNVTTEETCINDGTMTYTCTAEGCGATYTKDIPAKGHDFGETVTANAATCTAPGNKAYKQCKNCNLYFAEDAATDAKDGKADITSFVTEIDSDNHKKLVKTDYKAQTCEDDGNIEYWSCEGCNKIYKETSAETEISLQETVIAKKGHDYGDWKFVSNGEHKRVCKNDISHI